MAIINIYISDDYNELTLAHNGSVQINTGSTKNWFGMTIVQRI